MRIANALAGLGLLGAHLGMGGGGGAVAGTGRGTGRGTAGGRVGGVKAGSFGALMRAEEGTCDAERRCGEDPDQGGASPKAKKKTTVGEEQLDPMLAQSAFLAPPPVGSMAAATPVGTVEQQARTSLEDLLPALVRKVAWSGDGRRGTMRLELGAGALSGATLVVHADEGRVRVQLSAPEGADPAEWRARIEGRLAARGIDVEGVEVE